MAHKAWHENCGWCCTKIQPLNRQSFWSGRHPIKYLHLTIVMFVGLFTIMVMLKNTLTFQNTKKCASGCTTSILGPCIKIIVPCHLFFKCSWCKTWQIWGILICANFRITLQIYYQCNENNISCWCCIGILSCVNFWHQRKDVFSTKSESYICDVYPIINYYLIID